ncbi:MAG: small-conductance mechanosensitive channel [Planctomycetota bacterium]|jgi:small-conductance mechanosensitive channel
MSETKLFFENLLNFNLLKIGDFNLSVYNIFIILLIYLFTKFILFLITKAITSIGNKRQVNQENLYTLSKIISYFFWMFSFIFILNSLGLKVSALLTGSAALLVGIGLGLQQTFNDFISGIILLFEGKTKIHDIIEVDGKVLRLQNIGLRTTGCIDRDGISVIIPNSKIVTKQVINWSYINKTIRFNIEVNVAYGSDVEKVIGILEACASEHKEVTSKTKIEARFVNFGNSSLQFHLLFFSRNVFRIERVKSELRRAINIAFIENDIKIPFPQMDVHLNKLS